MLKFGNFILKDIKKGISLYFHNFFRIKGRSSRKEFLSVLVIYYIFNLFVSFISNKIHFYQEYILIIVLFISYFNAVVRRSHDFNINGWFFTVFIILIFFGYFYYYENEFFQKNTNEFFGIITIILTTPFLLFKGTPGPNKYGPPPEY